MNKRIYLIVTLIIIVLFFIGLCIFKNNNSNNKSFDINGLDFAIMIQKDGDTYEKYTGNTWPIDDYYFSKSECDNNAIVKWNYQTDSIVLTSNKSDNCTLYFDKKVHYDFNYEPNAQEFIAPVSGEYQIELWGAEGGGDEKASGGKGAYTKGTIYLNKDDKLYVYVGSKGEGGLLTQTFDGGYNGGGEIKEIYSASESARYTWHGFSGGGATDIRLNNGDWKDFDSLKSRIMVAAGGGGADYHINDNGYHPGGYGGALKGGDGATKPNWGLATGGSQVKGGYFDVSSITEKDVSAVTNIENSGGFGYGGIPYPYAITSGAGGSGYFGGGAPHEILNAIGYSSGGGGSSYISGYQGCVAIEGTSSQENIISKCTEDNAKNNVDCSYHYSGKIFKNTNMIAGNELMPSPTGNIETGHSGNGFARITLEKIETTYNFEFKPESQEFTAPVTGDYLIELWGAEGGGDEKASGGKGAYTKGTIYLDKDDKLYVYVGGQGQGGLLTQTFDGGYNGGGSINKIYSANMSIEWTWYGFTGGGATDVRLNKGDWNNFNSLKSRIMVASGGGGAVYKIRDNRYLPGGAGGALRSDDTTTNVDDYAIVKGATQTKGGYYDVSLATDRDVSKVENNKDNNGGFGYGGSPYPSAVLDGGGGSGYFGGGAPYEILNLFGGIPGSGGSSFISGYKGCVAIKDTSTEGNIIFKDNCTEENALNNIACSYHYSGKVFKETNMISGNSPMPSPTGGNETGHSGNGYARITLIS